MRKIDTSTNLNIAILLEMLEDVSKATRPQEAANSFAKRIGKLRRTDALVSVSVRNLPEGQYKITRFFRDSQQVTDASGLGSLNPWHQWAQLAQHSGGLVGQLIQTPEPKLFHHLSVADDPVLGDRLKDMGCAMAIPLLDGGQALNWAIHFRKEPEGYTLSELGDFLLTNNLFGSMTRNLVSLEQVSTLNEKLQQQFEEIARVQQALLPSELPTIPGLGIATSYLTSQQAGGDYYDFFDLRDGRWGILVADVSGHGPAAATVMAMLHAILHAYPDISCGPAASLRFANERLAAAKMQESFTTAIFAVYDPKTRDLTIARAGHPLPLVKLGNKVETIDGPSSFPLGIFDSDYAIEQHTIRLQPGQTVLLYTDGITEATHTPISPGGRGEMFAETGLMEALRASSGNPDDVVDAIHAALFKFTGRRTRDDDQTLVVLKVEE